MKDFYKLRIKSFKLLKYNVISIVLTDDSEYVADISSFQSVYCYPKNEIEWNQAYVGECKADIEWPEGFGIHLDQIAALATEQQKAS
jgi:hypothetical protein